MKLDLTTAEGLSGYLENIIGETLKTATAAERIMTEAGDDLSTRTLQAEFQRKYLDWTKPGTTTPMASRQRVGELGFLLQCLVNPELMFTHKSEFLKAVRDVRAKFEQRQKERVVSQPEADGVSVR